ncbi:MAG: hypothetical protein JWO67_5326 [Streptosporangiaceae bacterium]|jgi:hypothetical protein|nr:hypothetical protein [Streptosporangiaceae bacterium]
MTELLTSSTVTVTNTGVDPATGSLGYRFEDAEGKLLATAYEPKPRRPFWLRLAPPASPGPFRFRLLICDPSGRPILDVLKRQRFYRRLWARVALPSGERLGTATVKHRLNWLRGTRTTTYRLFDAEKKLFAEIVRGRGRYVVQSMIGWQIEDVRYSQGLGGTRSFYERKGDTYAFQRLDALPESLRALLLSWPIIANVAGDAQSSGGGSL